MRRLSIVALVLLPAVAALAGCGMISSIDNHHRAAAAASCPSTAVYVSTFGNGRQSIDEFCGRADSPTRRIPLPSRHTAGMLDHDDHGRLYLLTVYGGAEAGPESGMLSIFDGQWHNVDLPKGILGHMAVEREKGIVYVYHAVWNARHASITAIDAHGTILRTFSVEPQFPHGLLTIDSENHVVIVPDYTGNLFVYDPKSGKLRHRAPAFGCTVASGNNGKFYGLSCLGELAVYDPRSYKIIDRRKYGRGESFFGRETRDQPSIAIDSAGTLYLANQGTDTLSMYRAGKSTPFRVYAGLPIIDLQIDRFGDVYALVSTQETSGPEQINVYQHGTGVLIATYRFAANEYPGSMTVSSSPRRP